jgi:competence protein ComEC
MAVYKLIRKYIGIMKASVISIAVIIMYLIMTGETVSAKRAVCMLVLIIIADVYGRTFDILTGLSTAPTLNYVRTQSHSNQEHNYLPQP